MYLLTAVVPVYGISRNFENLRRMFNDLPQNIQVLVIHDKTDGEDATLLREITSPSNFTVIEVFGGSAGMTRNHGLPLIKSEWTMFWDADDRPFPVSILKAINDFGRHEIDLIVGSFTPGDETISDNLENVRGNNQGFVEESLFIEFGIWRCIFRSEKIKQINFSDLRIGEDLSFLLRALPNSNKHVYYSILKVYEYKNHSQGSITNSPLSDNDFDEALQEISKIEVIGDFKIRFKNQVLCSLLLSQFKRYPTVSKFINLVRFCFYNPRTVFYKLREMKRR